MSHAARIHHLTPRPAVKKPFLQPVPREIVFDLLQLKLQQIAAGEIDRLPIDYCVVSYLNDWLRCKDGTGRYVKSQADYARIWGWSRPWVNKHWEQIREAAEQQKTFYAGSAENGSRDTPVTPRLQVREQNDSGRDTKSAIAATEGHVRDTPVNNRLQVRDTPVTTYIEEPSDLRPKDLKEEHTKHTSTGAVDSGDGGGLGERERRKVFSVEEVESVYREYPRQVKKNFAMRAIASALSAISSRAEIDDPVAWLRERTRLYARSPAGQQGRFTPYAESWYEAEQYDDDPQEWQMNGDDAKPIRQPEQHLTGDDALRALEEQERRRRARRRPQTDTAIIDRLGGG